MKENSPRGSIERPTRVASSFAPDNLAPAQHPTNFPKIAIARTAMIGSVTVRRAPMLMSVPIETKKRTMNRSLIGPTFSLTKWAWGPRIIKPMRNAPTAGEKPR